PTTPATCHREPVAATSPREHLAPEYSPSQHPPAKHPEPLHQTNQEQPTRSAPTRKTVLPHPGHTHTLAATPGSSPAATTSPAQQTDQEGQAHLPTSPHRFHHRSV